MNVSYMYRLSNGIFKIVRWSSDYSVMSYRYLMIGYELGATLRYRYRRPTFKIRMPFIAEQIKKSFNE